MKYKDRILKYSIYSGVILVLLLIGLYVYGDTVNSNYPDYSTYSSKQKGAKALFLLTKSAGFDVSRYETTSRFIKDGVSLVVFNPDKLKFTDKLELKYMKEWISRGNTIVLLGESIKEDREEIEKIIEANEANSDDKTSSESIMVGKGSLIYLENSDDFTNIGLKTIDPAVRFINVLDRVGNKEVMFNEYYHGFGGEGISLWDLFGQTITLIIIQAFGALLIFLYYKSRRLGKPLVVFEVIKRQENENLYALSNIYIKSKSYVLVLDNILTSFKKQLSKYLGYNFVPEDNELIKSANSSRFLSKMNLKGVLLQSNEFSDYRKKDVKALVSIIKRIEIIRKGIKQ